MKNSCPLKKHSLLALMLALSSPAKSALLGDFYQQALLNDGKIIEAKALSLAGSEQENIGRSYLLPNVQLKAQTIWQDTEQKGFNHHGYTISLSQPIFDARAWFKFKQTQETSKLAKLEFELAQQGLIFRLVTGYLSGLEANAKLNSQKQHLAALERRLQQIKAQFEVGLAANLAVQETQAAYDRSQANLLNQENNLQKQHRQLERLTGLQIKKLDQLKSDYPIQAIPEQQPELWLEKARSGNLSLKIKQLALSAQQHNARAINSEHLPNLNMTAEQKYQSNMIARSSSQHDQSIGLSLSMPIFSGGATAAKSRQAQHQTDAAQARLDDSWQATKQTVTTLLLSLNTTAKATQARKQSLNSSQLALDATETGFELGSRSIQDVLNSEQKLYAAQEQYEIARFNYIRTLFTLKREIGSLSPADLEGLDVWLEVK